MKENKVKNHFDINPIFLEMQQQDNNNLNKTNANQPENQTNPTKKQYPSKNKNKYSKFSELLPQNKQKQKYNTSSSKNNNEGTTNKKQILQEKMQKVLLEKFIFLVKIYLNNASENGYNSKLGFRVISIYLYCGFKDKYNYQQTMQEDSQNSQSSQAQYRLFMSEINEQDRQIFQKFNLIEQINRFINAQLSIGELSNIQRCMDLIIIKQLNDRVAQKYINYWKILTLNALKKYYYANQMKRQKKQASQTLRQLCQHQLSLASIKNSPLYSQILHILLSQQSLLMLSKKNTKPFQALQHASNLIRILQKCQSVLVPKYQQKLMLAYWQTAQLHYQLHYVTYAKKYCEVVIRIGERIGDKDVVPQAKQMIEKLKQQ